MQVGILGHHIRMVQLNSMDFKYRVNTVWQRYTIVVERETY